jgi:hypothetical protein
VGWQPAVIQTCFFAADLKKTWWQFTQLFHNCDRMVRAAELPKAIPRPENCNSNFRELVLSCHAQGIAAESPQELHGLFRGLGAESPVFCGVSRKKCAQILS